MIHWLWALLSSGGRLDWNFYYVHRDCGKEVG